MPILKPLPLRSPGKVHIRLPAQNAETYPAKITLWKRSFDCGIVSLEEMGLLRRTAGKVARNL
jgi:hypothetical protein